MPPLNASQYLHHLADESHRFRSALDTCGEADPVPSCPEWKAADLGWHLAEVQAFWAHVIRSRPAEPDDYQEPERPLAWAALLDMFDASSNSLQSELRAAPPQDAAWSWHDEHTVAFTLRRQALEALIHRVDAEQTAGRFSRGQSEIDEGLAADGVDELLSIFFGGVPPWADHSPSDLVIEVTPGKSAPLMAGLGRFSGTSPTTGSVYVDEPVIDLRDAPTVADASITGSAEALLLWLWKRADDGPLRFQGDPVALAEFAHAVSAPID